MKKIYLTIAIALTAVASVVGQNTQANLSEDVITGMNQVNTALDYSKIQLEKAPVTNIAKIAGCDTLGTRWAGGNSQNGNMFDLTNTSTVSIQITSFDQCFATTGVADSVYILYKSGTFVGSEATMSAWTLAGQFWMTPTASLVPTAIPVPLTINIPAGGTYGFYITRTGTNYVAYTNGTAQGTAMKTKSGLEFKEGRGIAFPFGSAFGTAPQSRIWNGVIHFCSPLITGINGIEINESENVVYPNPSINNVNVNVSTSVGIDNATANVYDMSGRLVYSQSNINNNNFTVNHNLNSGLYVLQVVNAGTVVLNKKISVQ